MHVYQLNSHVDAELGEYVRELAHERRISMSETVRIFLKFAVAEFKTNPEKIALLEHKIVLEE